MSGAISIRTSSWCDHDDNSFTAETAIGTFHIVHEMMESAPKRPWRLTLRNEGKSRLIGYFVESLHAAIAADSSLKART